MLVIRSLIFNVGFVLITIFYAITCVVVAPFSYRWRYGFIASWCNVNLWWVRVACGIRYQLEGWENVPSTPCIVLCKHQSTWDTLAFPALFPPNAYVLKKELLFVPFFGWGLALTEPIAINRGSGRRAIQTIIEAGTKRLRQGRWVVIFPEGTRIAAGHKGRYGIGGPVLAEKSGFPVLPVALNAGEYWPRRSFIKKPGVVRMVIGPLIPAQGLSADQIRQQTEQWIENKMREISTVPYPQEPYVMERT